MKAVNTEPEITASRLVILMFAGLVSCNSQPETEPWSVADSATWQEAQSAVIGISLKDDGLVLTRPFSTPGNWKNNFHAWDDALYTHALVKAGNGQWTSKWHDWQRPVEAVEVIVDARIDLFDNKTVEVVVDGSTTPFTSPLGQIDDWYGRSMIAIIDQNRWVLALRSGTGHIHWDGHDAIHIITSTDEGRTWSKLDSWFDGTPIIGMPYVDGATHSEPGLYKMPNGDLILHFWHTSYRAGTRQLRSSDQGKTWKPDLQRIHLAGVTGAAEDRVIGTEDWFIDPENPEDVYMAFQYYNYEEQTGVLLGHTLDNGRSYQFLSWISPLTIVSGGPNSGLVQRPDNNATFEPAIEYVGNRTIVAILRHASGNRYTWQSVSTDMGRSFSQPVNISNQVDAGVLNGLWQRVRLYKDSNPIFQYGNQMDYASGEGRLWGFGQHSIAGGYTRKPVVFWSDNNGKTWQGPQLLHGEMYPGVDAGYGDLKRRVDNTYVASGYYTTQDSRVSDLEQYTFGGERARIMIEVDRDADGEADARSGWSEIYDGRTTFSTNPLQAPRYRFHLHLMSANSAGTPRIDRVQLKPVIEDLTWF